MTRYHVLRMCASLLMLGGMRYALAETAETSGEVLDTQKSIETLRMLAGQFQANEARVQRYEATYLVKVFSPVADIRAVKAAATEDLKEGKLKYDEKREFPIVTQRRVARVSVFVDTVHNRVRSDFVNVEPIIQAESRESEALTSSPGSDWKFIRTPEHFLEFSPTKTITIPVKAAVDERSGRSARGRVVRRLDSADRKGDRFGDFLDPSDLMGTGDMSFRRLCELYADGLEGKEKSPEVLAILRQRTALRRIKTGEYVTFVLHHRYGEKSEPNLTEAFTTFDERCGFNVTSYRLLKGGRPFRLREVTYIQEAGTWVVKTARLRQFDFEVKYDTPLQDRSVMMEHHQINGDISEKRFEVSDFGLQYSDILEDKLSGETKIFDGKEFVPAAAFTLQHHRLPKSSPMFRSAPGRNLE